MLGFFLEAETLILPDSVQKAQWKQIVERFTSLDAETFLRDFTGQVIWVALKIAVAFAIYAAGRWIINRLVRLMDASFDRRQVDKSLRSFLRSLVKGAAYTILLLIIVQLLGFNTTSLVALLVIFLLLYQEFRSLKIAGVILLNLPLALIGGVASLWFTSGEVSIHRVHLAAGHRHAQRHSARFALQPPARRGHAAARKRRAGLAGPAESDPDDRAVVGSGADSARAGRQPARQRNTEPDGQSHTRRTAQLDTAQRIHHSVGLPDCQP